MHLSPQSLKSIDHCETFCLFPLFSLWQGSNYNASWSFCSKSVLQFACAMKYHSCNQLRVIHATKWQAVCHFIWEKLQCTFLRQNTFFRHNSIVMWGWRMKALKLFPESHFIAGKKANSGKRKLLSLFLWQHYLFGTEHATSPTHHHYILNTNRTFFNVYPDQNEWCVCACAQLINKTLSFMDTFSFKFTFFTSIVTQFENQTTQYQSTAYMLRTAHKSSSSCKISIFSTFSVVLVVFHLKLPFFMDCGLGEQTKW